MTDNNYWQARRTMTRINMGNSSGGLNFANTIMVKLACGHSVPAEDLNPNGFSWCETCQDNQILSNDA